MEELQPEELEELVRELEGESDEEEALSPKVEELLRDLQPSSLYLNRQAAAVRLGDLSESSPRIVQSLIVAGESDAWLRVREAAMESLRAPVHQKIIQKHPDLMQRARSASEQVEIQRERHRGAQRALSPEVEELLGAQQQPSMLAPSELILLHLDRFFHTISGDLKLGGWVRMVNKNTDTEARELGRTMLAAAFLAVEQAGAVQLEVRRQQALFGLLVFYKLYVVPAEGATSWPSRSFESELRGIAERLQSKSGKGHNHVSEIVYDWWMRRARGKSSFPWATLGGLVRDGLAYRELLQKERKPGLKGFVAGESYVLPAETAAMVTQQPLRPVRELLATCERTRPEVWNLLIDGINEGIRKCKKPSDWD